VDVERAAAAPDDVKLAARGGIPVEAGGFVRFGKKAHYG
jgi:hypothetical protein